MVPFDLLYRWIGFDPTLQVDVGALGQIFGVEI